MVDNGGQRTEIGKCLGEVGSFPACMKVGQELRPNRFEVWFKWPWVIYLADSKLLEGGVPWERWCKEIGNRKGFGKADLLQKHIY